MSFSILSQTPTETTVEDFFFKALIRKYKESMKQDNSGKKEKIINYKI